MTTRSENPCRDIGHTTSMSEVTQAGDIYFLYRPRVQQEQVEDLSEVQRLYVVLKPWEQDSFRLLVVPRKRLPEATEETERLWGFVAGVFKDAQGLWEAVGREARQTKTRGERVQPGARPAGEGAYVLARHGDHTHLAYELQLPEEPDGPQRELNLAPQASLVVTVKNPDVPSPPGTGLPEYGRANFPDSLRDRFVVVGSSRWTHRTSSTTKALNLS